MMVSMLTTVDNPFDPFDQFMDWYRYDTSHGYNSCAYLDRIANTSDSLSDQENRDEINRAIIEIIKFDPTNMFCKVTKEVNE